VEQLNAIVGDFAMAALSKPRRKAPLRKWSKNVKTESTFPPEGTFVKPGEQVARIMARKDVSPGGLGSAIRMVQFFINRAGQKMTAERRRELEKAKRILREMKNRGH
jgi:Protein of unknown function (DUF3175)